MKSLIKLLIAALIANATWHLFVAYSAHYKFRDAVQNAAQNRGDKSDDQLHEIIMNLAAEADVPVPFDGVVVSHEGRTTSVVASYTQTLELIPSRPYSWPFSFRIDTYTLETPLINELAHPK